MGSSAAARKLSVVDTERSASTERVPYQTPGRGHHRTTLQLSRESKRARARHRSSVTAEELAELERLRPRTRGDCVDGLRPCPFAGCRYHLYLDVDEDKRSRRAPDVVNINIPRPDVPIERMTESCALDVAERGGGTLEDLGVIYGVSRERIRQIEAHALKRVRLHEGGRLEGMQEALDELEDERKRRCQGGEG